MSEPPLISAALAEFIQSGLSITVAGRSARLVPSIARAVACRVDADRRAVAVLLFGAGATAVCADIRQNRQVAVCFSRPSTHETVQLKGSDARVEAATPQDVAAARLSLDLFAEDLGPLGWGPNYVDTLFWRPAEDLLAIRFTPLAAYAQTPGPAAGTLLKA